MSKQEQLKKIIIRYQQGKCNEEEIAQLRALLQEMENPGLLEEVYDILPEAIFEDKRPPRKAAIYQQVINDERVRDTATTFDHTPWWRKPWIAVAAAALLALVPFLYNNLSIFTNHNHASSEERMQYAIMPGGDRALIILDDGTEVNLEKIIGDTVIARNGFSIVKDGDGAIYYQYDNADALVTTNMHNTVVTPKGGQYQVVLPDGTRVWLNAQSKLRYPVYFDQEKREVELEGEGYFEVAKQTINGKRLPFIVNSGAQKLEVLGTTFNIHGYGQDVITTLVEGKVRLELENTSKEVLLQANDQAILRAGMQQYDVRKIDPIYATAWKDGNFSFRKASIKDVMESVGRWYDIDVVYETAVENSQFTGTISRFEQIDKLLQLIELTGSVHFTIEGRRVVVKE